MRSQGYSKMFVVFLMSQGLLHILHSTVAMLLPPEILSPMEFYGIIQY